MPGHSGPDVMVGARALSRAGISELKAGGRITVLSERNDRGERVAEILSVESASSRGAKRRFFDLAS